MTALDDLVKMGFDPQSAKEALQKAVILLLNALIKLIFLH
jgi:hypothetical protein